MQNSLPPSSLEVAESRPRKRNKTLYLFLCVVGIILLTLGICYWWFIYRNLNADELEVSKLDQTEKILLEAKRDALEGRSDAVERLNKLATEDPIYAKKLENDRKVYDLPEGPHIRLTEKEINAWLVFGNDDQPNPELKGRIRIELTPNTFTLLGNYPVPKDSPFLAGNNVRAKVSIMLMKVDDKMSMMVEDVNVGGFPMPDAWLGGIKDQELLNDFNNSDLGRAFVRGIKDFRILDGEMILVPNE